MLRICPILQLNTLFWTIPAAALTKWGAALAGPVVAGCVVIPADTQSLPFWTDVPGQQDGQGRAPDRAGHDNMTHTW